MAVETLDSKEARSQWRALLDAAASGKQDTVITRYGKPVAAVIDYDDWVALQDELDDVRAGRRALAAVEEWERDPSLAMPFDDFKKELIAEGLLNATD